MIIGGYYIKARKIQESDIAFAPPHVREIWDLLIKEANHADNRNFKRGDCFKSLRDIQDDLKWFVGYRKEVYSKSKCEMAMNWLRKRGMITTTKTTRGMIITVCNYDTYQNPKNYETNGENITKATSKEQQSDTINKNERTINNEKNKNIILLSQVDESTFNGREKEYFQITCAFWELVKANLIELDISISGIENAEYEKWTSPIRLLIENDKYNINEIREVFTFLKDDDFWKQQIRSTAKLRKKDKDGIKYFEKLLIRSRNEQKRKSTAKSGKSGVSDNYKNSIRERLLRSSNPEEM